MGLTRAEIALALIAVVDAGELTWDLAHGSPGTYWVLKIVVLVGTVAAIAALRLRRRLAGRRASPGDDRGAASPPRPRTQDADAE